MLTVQLDKARVADVMTRRVVKARPGMTVLEAAKIMASEDIGALPVVDERERLVGMLSERDIVRRVVAAEKDPAKVTVGDVMTPKPVTVKPDYTVADALRIMAQLRIRHLPVVDDKGNLVGIISVKDIENVII